MEESELGMESGGDCALHSHAVGNSDKHYGAWQLTQATVGIKPLGFAAPSQSHACAILNAWPLNTKSNHGGH